MSEARLEVSKKHAGRFAGACLMAAAALTVLAMGHHPTSVHGGGVGGYVHGAMIVALTVMFFGFSYFALRSGIDRPVILAGLIAYGVSSVASLGAGTINGFVVPVLAALGPDAVSRDIFVLCWQANQALAQLGVFATGAAYALWSIYFMQRSDVMNRIVGAAGLAAAILPAAALASGVVEMNVAGAFAIYSVHAAWSALVGVRLIQGKI